MNSLEYLNPVNNFTERVKDITLTKRSYPKILNTLRRDSTSRRHRFIPFYQERDSIGRLIKKQLTSIDLARYKSDPISSKSANASPMKSIHTHNLDTSETQASTQQHTSSHNLLKLVENSIVLKNRREEDASPSSGMNYRNLSSHQYYIDSGENNTLEVKNILPKISPEFNIPSPIEIVKTMESSSTLRESMVSVTGRNICDPEELPPLHINKTRDVLQSPASLTPTHSSNNVKYISMREGIRDEINVQPESFSVINTSAWKFEATPLSQNKEGDYLARKQKKSTSRLKKLTIPLYQEIPPLGIYKADPNILKTRTKTCLILPEQSPKSHSTEPKKQEECKKLHALKKKQPVETEKVLTGEQYYKHLFKGILDEADKRSKGARKEDYEQKIKRAKQLDYIVLDEFKRFPTDFEKKMNDMKKRLKGVKDKLNATKEYKDDE